MTLVLALPMLGSVVHALENVSGANLSLALNPSARTAGAGDASLALHGTVLTLGQSPVGMLDVDGVGFGLSHTEHYEGTKLDAIAGVIALDTMSRLGLQLFRYGADGIPWIKSGEPLPDDGAWRTLSIADYALSVAYARRLPWHLASAVSLHFLYRELDQSGFGFRGDAGLRWNPWTPWFLTAQLEGWTSSATRWESGTTEYSSPELKLATGFMVPVEYIYGTVSIGYQGPGVFHEGNRWMSISASVLDDTLNASTPVSLGGEQPWKSPLEWLKDGSVGAELEWDWGGSVRCGLQSLRETESWTVGGGLRIFGWLTVDYSYARHPVLSGVHRVSLEAKPWWTTKPKLPATTVATPAKADAAPTPSPLPEPVAAPQPQHQDQGSKAPVPPDSTQALPQGKSWEE